MNPFVSSSLCFVPVSWVIKPCCYPGLSPRDIQTNTQDYNPSVNDYHDNVNILIMNGEQKFFLSPDAAYPFFVKL